MIDVNNTPIAELVNHAKFEQSVPSDLSVLRLLLGYFVDLKGLVEVLKATRAIVHEISYLETGLIFSFLLIQRHLQVAESQLPVNVKLVQLVPLLIHMASLFLIIEDLRRYLAQECSRGVKDIEFFKKKSSVESCYTLTLLCQLHVEPGGLLVLVEFD